MLAWIEKDTNNAHRAVANSKAGIQINKTKDPETGELVDNPKKVAEIIAQYLDGQQFQETPSNIDWDGESDAHEITEFVVTEEMMDIAMKQTSTSSTLDPYGISATDLKSVYGAVKAQLISITKQSFKESYVPSMIKRVNIIMLPKPRT